MSSNYPPGVTGGEPQIAGEPEPTGPRHLREAWAAVEEALKVISTVWASDPNARTPRLTDAVNLLERAKGKIWKEMRGRPCTDEEAKQAVAEFLDGRGT